MLGKNWIRNKDTCISDYVFVGEKDKMTCDERTNSIALINRAVYPMTAPGRSDAVYARGGVIRAIGKNSDILSMCDSKTVVLDMKGKSLLPVYRHTRIF